MDSSLKLLMRIFLRSHRFSGNKEKIFQDRKVNWHQEVVRGYNLLLTSHKANYKATTLQRILKAHLFRIKEATLCSQILWEILVEDR